jgi:hypothetical protein
VTGAPPVPKPELGNEVETAAPTVPKPELGNEVRLLTADG